MKLVMRIFNVGSGKRGQLELWMLTKMAMLFFIVSLAFIAFNISTTEKAALCGEQAISTAGIIASNINQVLVSEVEDERLVYKLDSFLSVGKEKYERYDLVLQTHEFAGSNKVQLSVVVKPRDASCMRSVSIFYDKDKIQEIRYQSPKSPNPSQVDSSTFEFTLEPSTQKVNERSRFLVITKCHVKEAGAKNILHVDDCRQDDPVACSPIGTLDGCKIE